MAISFVGFATAAGTGAPTPAMPAGATAGDLLIVFIEGEGEDANADNMTDTAAWTLGGTVASATDGAADRTRLTWWWAWYDAAINRQAADAGNHTIVALTAWRGVDTTTPFDTAAVSASDNTNDTAANFAGITTVTDGAAVVFATSAGDDNGAGASVGFSAWSAPDLASITEVVDYGSGAGSDGSIGVAWGVDTVAGSVAAATATIGASEESASWTIALRPAGGAPSGTPPIILVAAPVSQVRP